MCQNLSEVIGSYLLLLFSTVGSSVSLSYKVCIYVFVTRNKGWILFSRNSTMPTPRVQKGWRVHRNGFHPPFTFECKFTVFCFYSNQSLFRLFLPFCLFIRISILSLTFICNAFYSNLILSTSSKQYLFNAF